MKGQQEINECENAFNLCTNELIVIQEAMKWDLRFTLKIAKRPSSRIKQF